MITAYACRIQRKWTRTNIRQKSSNVIFLPINVPMIFELIKEVGWSN